MDVTSKFSVDLPDNKQGWKELVFKIATGAKDVLFEYEHVPTVRSLLRQTITRLFLSTSAISVIMAVPSILAQHLQMDLFTTAVGYLGLAATVSMFLIHGYIFIAGFAQYGRDY